MKSLSPRKIVLPKNGTSTIGFLTATTNADIPFPIKNIFWTYFTPENVVRGRHAHKKNTIIIFALTGKIIITTETRSGVKKTFTLNKPNVGLLVPPMVWHTQRYSHTAIQLVLCSQPYSPKDYIRDYKGFR